MTLVSRNNNDNNCETKLVVCDYLSWRLDKAGYRKQLCYLSDMAVDSGSHTHNLCLVVRRLALELEKCYRANYPKSLSDHLHLVGNNCRDLYLSILIDLFQLDSSLMGDFDCNWGRIIALISFSGCLAVKCCEVNSPEQVASIRDWLVDFLTNDARIRRWLESRGYWADLIKFNNQMPEFDSPDESDHFECEQNERGVKKELLLKFNTFFGMTVGLLGLLTLGFMYAKRFRDNLLTFN